jgi:hypothetical protein
VLVLGHTLISQPDNPNPPVSAYRKPAPKPILLEHRSIQDFAAGYIPQSFVLQL